MSVIKKIEDAETKDQLEALGLEAFGADVDKRKGVETIRAELMELAEAQEGDATDEAADPQSHADAQLNSAADRPSSAESAPETTTATQDPAASSSETAKEKAYPGRQLRNLNTGRLMPWTPQLAKKRNMQEV